MPRQILWIEARREFGRADEIAEHDRVIKSNAPAKRVLNQRFTPGIFAPESS
jgi:hypothetical protein